MRKWAHTHTHTHTHTPPTISKRHPRVDDIHECSTALFPSSSFICRSAVVCFLLEYILWPDFALSFLNGASREHSPPAPLFKGRGGWGRLPLRGSIVVALPQLCVEGFDVSVGGRALDDDEGVVSLQQDVCLDVSANSRGLSVLALREAGREVSEAGLLEASARMTAAHLSSSRAAASSSRSRPSCWTVVALLMNISKICAPTVFCRSMVTMCSRRFALRAQ